MQNWQMQEVLNFPAHFGTVQQGSIIKVEPNWQTDISEESVVIKGVYVLKGNMQFDFKERELTQEEGTLIEHLAIEKDEAYFEYALPFAIDIPNEDVENVAVKVLKSAVEVNEAGYCVCSWEVCCDVEKKSVQKELAIVQEDMKREATAEEVHTPEPLEYVKTFIEETPQLSNEEVDFFEQLAEAYSVVQVQLKAHK